MGRQINSVLFCFVGRQLQMLRTTALECLILFEWRQGMEYKVQNYKAQIFLGGQSRNDKVIRNTLHITVIFLNMSKL